VMRWKVDFYP